MKLSAILEPLVAAGVDAATILATVKAWEEQQTDALERRRANDRERQERRRHVTSRDVTVTVSSRAGATRVEDKPLPTEIEPQEEKQTNARSARRVSDVSEFKAELADHVDAERIEAVIKHRRSKRGQITGHAARLFLRDAAAAGLSPADAIDTCISRNWITVKAEWLAGRANARAGPAHPNRPEHPADAAARLLEQMRSADDRPATTDRRYPAPLVAISGGRFGVG